MYFYSGLHDENVLLVVEVVAISEADNGQVKESSCGWGFYRMFESKKEYPDLSSGSSGPALK